MAVRNRLYARILTSLVVVLIAMGATLVGLTAFKPHQDEPVNEEQAGKSEARPMIKKPVSHIYSLPVRIVIPKINVDAPILPMGLTPSGAMDSPKTNQDTGWYSTGVRPGNVGSAVIAGHLGMKNDAVFGKAHTLTAGDKISVTDDQGATATFTVTHSKEYEKDSDTTSIFNSKEGSHLNLITCEGDWNSSESTYEKRLVVFSKKT